MKNKLIVMGYSILIVVAFYSIIYAATLTKPNHKAVFNLSDVKTSVIESLSGEINSGEEMISGEELVSGEIIATLSAATTEENNIKENYESIDQKVNKIENNSQYYIKINNAQNVVTIYKKDVNGEYSIPYKAMICSTGDATPAAGEIHKITTYKKRWNALQGDVYGQYATQIVGNILFHSVPYTAKNNSALEYWEYDKLGTAASLGCIRLTVADAKWIYDNISSGTIVEFYEDSNPGPLGKPTAKKISDNEFCRNWDPTDLANGNPWNALPEKVDTYETVEKPAKQTEELFIKNNVDNIVISGESIQNSGILLGSEV